MRKIRKIHSKYDKEELTQFFEERKIVMPTAGKNKRTRLDKKERKLKRDLKRYCGRL